MREIGLYLIPIPVQNKDQEGDYASPAALYLFFRKALILRGSDSVIVPPDGPCISNSGRRSKWSCRSISMFSMPLNPSSDNKGSSSFHESPVSAHSAAAMSPCRYASENRII